MYFSVGLVVKNPPANVGDRGSSPGQGGFHIPQSNEALQPQLLSLHPEPVPARREAPPCHNYDSPLAAMRKVFTESLSERHDIYTFGNIYKHQQ